MITTKREESKAGAARKSIQKINLGIDVHADSYVVVRQVDGQAPQPAQRFKPEEFMKWVSKQAHMAEAVYSCYEAGPFGYVLERELQALGIQNLVVTPRNWDETGKGVKTDRSDAMAMVRRLDQYVRGDRKALSVVRVPSQAEERLRSQARQRDQLREHRQRLEAQGRSLMLQYGHRVQGRWWQPSGWQKLLKELPGFLVELLGPLAKLAQEVHRQVQELSKRLELAAPQRLVRGIGALSYVLIQREVCDWQRFKNRRQVASYTGMCARVHASGPRFSTGAINKHGNPRIRRLLVEMAWRMLRYQPGYKPLVQWKERLVGTNRAIRNKTIVAVGRKLAIDLWRMATARCSAEELGLVMN